MIMANEAMKRPEEMRPEEIHPQAGRQAIEDMMGRLRGAKISKVTSDEQLGEAARRAGMESLFKGFVNSCYSAAKDHGNGGVLRGSEASRYSAIPDVFKDAEIQYAYNQRQKIYSVKATLDNRPRIITMRIGDNFTEMSIADKNANILEILRQEEGKGIMFTKAR